MKKTWIIQIFLQTLHIIDFFFLFLWHSHKGRVGQGETVESFLRIQKKVPSPPSRVEKGSVTGQFWAVPGVCDQLSFLLIANDVRELEDVSCKGGSSRMLGSLPVAFLWKWQRYRNQAYNQYCKSEIYKLVSTRLVYRTLRMEVKFWYHYLYNMAKVKVLHLM